MTEEEREKRAQEKVESAKKHIATALNHLEIASQDLEYVFEIKQDWNDMVKFGVDEGVVKCGFALATLVNWNDD